MGPPPNAMRSLSPPSVPSFSKSLDNTSRTILYYLHQYSMLPYVCEPSSPPEIQAVISIGSEISTLQTFSSDNAFERPRKHGDGFRTDPCLTKTVPVFYLFMP